MLAEKGLAWRIGPLFAVGMITAYASAGTVELIDQSAEEVTILRAIPFFSLAQSFVPEESSLDFVYLTLTDPSTATNGSSALVKILEGSLNGDILGVSETLFFEDCFNFEGGPNCGIAGGFPVEARFDFTESVLLSPGTTYVIQIDHVSGDGLGVGMTNADSYPPGGAWVDGSFQSVGDLWFREGLFVPEPSTWLLLGLGATMLCRRRV